MSMIKDHLIQMQEAEISNTHLSDIEIANSRSISLRSNPAADSLLGLYFPVLDHGFVSLVDYMGNDASIAAAARCSYGAGTKAASDDRGLIRYLVRHKHTSPLEQVELKFHCKMPIFVARQWVRHRTASLNEMSGRYSIMPLQFYTPDSSVIRAQSKTNKQGREEFIDQEAVADYLDNLSQSRTASEKGYISALKDDVARELARIDLPLSTYTEWYWKIDLHNLMNFLRLRCEYDAQYEIRVYADLIAGMLKKIVPFSYEAWVDYIFGSEVFSFQEMQALHKLINDIASSGSCTSLDECLPSDIAKFAEENSLSKRDAQEFVSKLKPKARPDFNLDMSKAKTPEYFREQALKYVPVIK